MPSPSAASLVGAGLAADSFPMRDFSSMDFSNRVSNRSAFRWFSCVSSCSFLSKFWICKGRKQEVRLCNHHQSTSACSERSRADLLLRTSPLPFSQAPHPQVAGDRERSCTSTSSACTESTSCWPLGEVMWEWKIPNVHAAGSVVLTPY